MTIFWYWGGDREAAEVALSPWRKKRAIGDLLEKVFSHFIPYMTIFLVLGGIGKLLKLLLVHGEKRGYRGSAGEGFFSFHPLYDYFFIGEGYGSC
jgi:hypothetical protein